MSLINGYFLEKEKSEWHYWRMQRRFYLIWSNYDQLLTKYLSNYVILCIFYKLYYFILFKSYSFF